MRKVTIVALHLGYGGIEKAIASLANMLCDEYEINIISTYKLYDEPPFKIDKNVKIEYLIEDKPNKKEFLYAFKKGRIITATEEAFKGITLLHFKKSKMINAIKNVDSDIFISTRAFHNNLVGKYSKSKSLKIAWEHSHHNGNKKYINRLVKSCENMDYLITVSKELNNFYSKKIGKEKCKHISLSLDEIPKKLSDLNKEQITSIGRLSREKGFSDLILMFKTISAQNPTWHLNIIGDGLEKEALTKLIIDNNLTKKITMHGFKNKEELNKILLDTSIYVMTSLTESFGLVLIEAMSYGIPPLAFDSAQGANEIIDNKLNGYIIKDRNQNEMITKINELINDSKLRKEIGQESYKKSLIFSTEKVKKDWIKLFEKSQN